MRNFSVLLSPTLLQPCAARLYHIPFPDISKGRYQVFMRSGSNQPSTRFTTCPYACFAPLSPGVMPRFTLNRDAAHTENFACPAAYDDAAAPFKAPFHPQSDNRRDLRRPRRPQQHKRQASKVNEAIPSATHSAPQIGPQGAPRERDAPCAVSTFNGVVLPISRTGRAARLPRPD
ncbi:hypothetical protein KCP69_03735 [Salmonella enterica subsp. enterica]|nr:hypothetical protein KCP69_03735 [Salmonella enterica subsp. enterica]